MNILGIDFEDWYHPQLVQPYITKEKKPTMFQGMDRILELLNKNETFATFFVVGELLYQNPELLDKIIDNGHEVAFHTMHHDRLDSKNFSEKFDDELDEFDKLTDGKSKGFRAPTFSLNQDSSWVIEKLEKHDYVYDSSIVPAKSNLYGMPNAQQNPYKISSNSLDKHNSNGKLIEFPLAITKFFGKKIPAAGGFYLRSLPMKITKNTIKNYEKNNIPATFFIHSWELTPEFIPQIILPFKPNFVTFHNIKKSYSRMNEVLENFNFTSFKNYMDKYTL